MSTLPLCDGSLPLVGKGSTTKANLQACWLAYPEGKDSEIVQTLNFFSDGYRVCDILKCPEYRGGLISGVDLTIKYTLGHWDISKCHEYRGGLNLRVLL